MVIRMKDAAKRGNLNIEIKRNAEIPHQTLPKEETILYKCGPFHCKKMHLFVFGKKEKRKEVVRRCLIKKERSNVSRLYLLIWSHASSSQIILLFLNSKYHKGNTLFYHFTNSPMLNQSKGKFQFHLQLNFLIFLNFNTFFLWCR